LTQVLQGATTTESYSYDTVGNRLSLLGVSPYTYNSSNQLTSTPGATYTYDNNGNTLTKTDVSGTTTYAWDFENQLTSVTLPGSGGTGTFKYDPFGRRIYKSPSSGTSIFAYDGKDLIEETNSSGGVVARYAQSADKVDEPLAMLRSGTTNYYNADGLGSITSLSNAVGALAQTYTFDSFGNQTASSGSLVNSFRYTAREFDPEINLYYYRARYYDPASGKFVNEDPIGFDGGDNFYRYVYNGPTGSSDPLGLSPADVQRIQAACKRCTQGLTEGGYRLPGSGGWRGFRNDNQVLLGILTGLLHGDPRDSGRLQGCKSQAGLVKPCLEGDPTLSGWKFSEAPWWLGSHTIVKGESSDPNDPLVYCDPWRNYTWTAPSHPDIWPRYSKW